MSKVEKFWENATADDVARVMAGETVEARFRDLGTEPWTGSRALGGWSNQGWVSGLTWNHCQVYREPSWYADKPDPGPGFRILHPDERVEKGDEYYSSANNMWLLSGGSDACDCKQANFPYRRRIEPVEPEPQHYILRAGDTANISNGLVITITAKGFEVTQ
jgi:hypothetical protein